MDLCFNEPLVDLAKLGIIGGGMLDVKVFPDVLSVGSIADMNPEARVRELTRFGINPSTEFVGQCHVAKAVAQAEQVRIWVERPYRLLPEVLYIAGLTRDDAKVTACEYSFEDKKEVEFPLDREACNERWHELVMRNTPLRVVENGQLICVGDDYFDKALLDAWEGSRGGSRREAVGKVFYSYAAASGVSFPDDFLSHRLEKLLAGISI